MGGDGHRAYLLQEWELFVAHPERGAVASEIRRHIAPIRLVADVGCGAGQELLPHLGEAMCIGFDVSAEAPPLARELLGRAGGTRLGFARARAEALPLAGATIDLLISRLVLPYTHVPSAMREAARVLRPGGGFSVQFHSPWFYLRKLRRAVVCRDRVSARYAIRVLRTGTAFHLTREHRAVRGTLETFLTTPRLRTLAASAGLQFVDRIGSTNPYAPHLLFRRP